MNDAELELPKTFFWAHVDSKNLQFDHYSGGTPCTTPEHPELQH
jgi:hypothetical protein